MKKIHNDNIQSLWSRSKKFSPLRGFCDDYLEFMIRKNLDDLLSLEDKSSPILFWTSELYGLGKCYREWLGWPNWLPLTFYDDHGPCPPLQFAEHEINNSSKYHLTPILKRAQFNKSVKKIIQAPNPWIMYKRKVGYKKRKDAQGTIIFYPHSVDDFELLDYDWDSYFILLNALPSDFHPFVICLHRHDIYKGYHKRLRKYGLPIVTLGDTLSPYFVDRFYSMISNFKYATSNTGGSEVFLCEEHNVNYFIYGERPNYFNTNNNQISFRAGASDKYLDEPEHLKRKYFTAIPNEFSKEKKQLISDILGTHLDTKELRTKIRKIMYKETIRLSTKIIEVIIKWIFKRLYFKVCKIFSKIKLKKLR